MYKFTPVDSDEHYFYLSDNNIIYPIEREICRDIVNANKIKTVEDIERLKEKIIFPYDDSTSVIRESEMQDRYPYAYAYLLVKQDILSTRDKGERKYETWYAYGRRQSMDIHAFKLFFPHICERPSFVICEEMELLFYNGIAIVSDNLQDLKVIKKIMESSLFLEYIRNTTKDYSSGYISMSRNYLKNFGIYCFNEQQRTTLLELDNANDYLCELYNIKAFHMDQ